MKRFCKGASGALCVAVIVLVGCNKPGGKDKDKSGGDKHDHPSAGPHGGPLVEWGEEEYHVEVVIDRPKQEVRAYILGPDAKKAAPIKADKLTVNVKNPKFDVELKPEPQKDDPKGTSSLFTAKHENFGKDAKLAGSASAQVEKENFSGDFDEESVKKKK